MTNAPEVSSDKVTDFTIPEGCLLCGADLPVRITPAGAQSVCKRCAWFAKPQVTVTRNGFQVSYSPAAQA